MTIAAFTPETLLAILPELLLFIFAGLVVAIDMLTRSRRKTSIGWLATLALLITMVAALVFSRPDESQPLILGGMLRHDWLAFSFKILILFAAAISSLLAIRSKSVGERGEYFALLLVATMGMQLMAGAADLIMLFLAIETTSIPLYVLAGFIKTDDRSTESGLKYFLFGATTSAIMLYGFSLLFGFTGETNLYALSGAILESGVSSLLITSVAILTLVGFSFKVAAVPFHFWTPDVYEGAPTAITAYVSTASKAAGFAILLRVMVIAFPSIQENWAALLAAIAVLTMTLGNILAIAQKNIKRLLAYSSIAHAGYALIGLVALSQFGVASMVFYLIGYVVTNLAAFAVVIIFADSVGSEMIEDYAGLSRRSPWLAMALLVALLSLAGMPPLVGFVAKFYVFAAAVESGLIWLAFIGVINAIIGLYYYLTILKVVYLYRSEGDEQPLTVPTVYGVGLFACIAGILVIGILSGPWLDWMAEAARILF